MWYVIRAWDLPGSLELRRQVRSDHLARLRALLDQGRLLTAGPLPAVDAPDPGGAGFSGSLMVLDFESLAAAERWAAEDPFVAAGVYARVEVHPYIQALP
jgi:uncharacterized protein YciI